MKKLIGILLTVILFTSVFAVSYTEWREEKLRELAKASALEDLMDNSYECVRVSLLPTDNFSQGYIELFDGVITKEVDYEFTSPLELYSFMEEIFAYQFDLGEIYLYVDPIELQTKKTTALQNPKKNSPEQYDLSHVTDLFALYSESKIYCILPAYSASYWNVIEETLEQKEQCLVDFVELVSEYPNVETFYMGYEEWLISNPANYVDSKMNNEDIHALLTGFVMRDENYLLTKDNVEDKLELTREASQKALWEQVISEQPMSEDFIDFSKKDIVLIGDSIFGNYTDSASIAGVIEGFSNANVYICAQGGATAVPTEEFPFDFQDMVERFLSKDVEDMEDCTYKQGVLKYDKYSKGRRDKVFVINFGINDYYRGIDIEDFEDCLQKGLWMLKEKYPNATYIVMGANYVTMYESGTILHNEDTKGLISYVEATRKVAAAEDVLFLDNYKYFQQIVKEELVEEMDDLLADRTHPNEYGRYLLGKRIIEAISTLEQEAKK